MEVKKITNTNIVAYNPGDATWTFTEAFGSSWSYYNKNDLPANVFLDKYALRDQDGKYVERDPRDMHQRLAYEFARMDALKYGYDFDKRRETYVNALANFQRIVPQGSPMSAIGNPFQKVSASNCVVIGSPEDSMEGIISSGEELAQLMKRRCGVGVDISTLRPEGLRVNNAAKTTSGAWSFADFFSYVTRMVCQSGRRGALMITMDVHHPDIEKFITMKMDKTKVTGANVSVRYSDEFMQAVLENKTYEQRWPLEGTPQMTRKVKARQVWDLAVECATNSAEPGCIFWDTMVNYLPAHSYPQFKTISTNPCSEIALSAYDSCRLISINLTGYVRKPFTSAAYFDWNAFEEDICLATQMSDTLVDLELERIEQIIDACGSPREEDLWRKLWKAGYEGRRVGLGTHALGDVLSQLGIKYDSDEALEWVDTAYRVLRDTTYAESIQLAKERGPFPAWSWDLEKDNAFIKRLPQHLQDDIALYGRRNIANLTNAPTGSVSMCSKTGVTFTRFGTSSGIEPVYALHQMRRKKISSSDDGARVDYVDELGDEWQEYDVFHANVANYLDLYPEVTKNNLPEFFVEADSIDSDFRVRLQGVEQKYIDHSISSTINLPRGTKPDVVGAIYLNAWKHGLKGVTVYVDGSRDQVIHKANDRIDPSQRPEAIVRMEAPKRPKELDCDIHHTTVKGQKYIAIVGLMNGEPYEFFGGFPGALSIPKTYGTGKLIKRAKGTYRLHIGKNGDSIIVDDIANTLSTPEMGWQTRLISTALRHGTPLDFLVEQMTKTGKLNDFNKVIGRVLKKYIIDGTKIRSSAKCDRCFSNNLKWQEGCPQCMECGYTKCN